MPQSLFLKPFLSAPSHTWSQNQLASPVDANIKIHGRMNVVSMSMLKPRKFMQKRRKVETFKDAADEADQKNWRRVIKEIEEAGSAVSVLRSERTRDQALPKDLVIGTLVRFKQLKKWNLVGEILEWLRTQHWWDFNEMDYLMLITSYGKQGDFNKAERVLSYMNKNGYPPSVISHTALMEAYGRGGQHNKAEAIFRRMQSSGPEPSAFTYQIILKTFVEGDKFKEAEETFETLLNENSPLKPDQKMFHMMIYMYKKAGNYEKARKTFAMMAERGLHQSTVTYNSLMSFETNYKEVSKIYDQMQRAGLQPDVVSYALLIKAYGTARREVEALAVFEEMLDAGVRKNDETDIKLLPEYVGSIHYAHITTIGIHHPKRLLVPTTRPTQKAYNILLDAFAISGMVEQAKTVFKSMGRDRCTPDLCSYTTMLSAYVNASDMEGAEKFFKRFGQDNLEPNIVTYGILIKGYAKINDLEKMMGKYEEMRGHGIKSNQTILTTIMDAYGKNKDFESAVIWYKEMESSGTPPDKKAKNILLSLAKTVEELEEARELVGETILPLTSVAEDSDEDSEEDEDENKDCDKEEDLDEVEVELMVFNGNYQQNEGGLHSLSLDKL